MNVNLLVPATMRTYMHVGRTNKHVCHFVWIIAIICLTVVAIIIYD